MIHCDAPLSSYLSHATTSCELRKRLNRLDSYGKPLSEVYTRRNKTDKKQYTL